MRQTASKTANERRLDAAGVALLALAVSVAGIMNDFVYDDVPLVVDNFRLHSLRNLAELVSAPYWPPPFVEQLYRPLAVTLFAVEWAIGAGSPIVFRLVSYALYVASALSFFRLASMLVSRRVAFGAALLFAVHPVHVEAVALGVNQGELIVAICGMMMLARYIGQRRAVRLAARDWLVIAAWYAVAVLTKENGFILPVLLIAAETTVLREAGGERPAGLMLLPGYSLIGGVAVAAFALRQAVLGGLVGASPAHALIGLSFGERAFTMLQVVPQWLRLLVWPQRLQADFAPDAFVLPATIGSAEVLGAMLVLGAGIAIAATHRRVPVLSFGLLCTFIALVPVSNLVPTGIMLAERTLFLPSVGLLVAAAAAGEALLRQTRWDARAAFRALSIVVCVLVLLGAVRSASRHSVWNSAHLVVLPPSD